MENKGKKEKRKKEKGKGKGKGKGNLRATYTKYRTYQSESSPLANIKWCKCLCFLTDLTFSSLRSKKSKYDLQ
jgi:hypothetical protein